MLLLATQAPGDSTISPGERFAFSANTGWISFRHDQPSSPAGVSFGDFFLSGHAHSANLGWIDFGDGSPANGIRYANGGSGDCGVNHDGRGNLSGFAYGANIGWINFGWAAADHPDRPRVNLLTGSFAGFAYGANIGWINLGSGFLTTTSMAIADSDGDGMADSWERQFFGDLATATPVTDSDHDGTSDKSEYYAGTAPNDPADYLCIVSTAFNGTFTQATVVFTTQPTRLYRLDITEGQANSQIFSFPSIAMSGKSSP